MKDAIGAIGFLLILAGGMMADSATLTPTIVCVMLGGVALFVSNGLFEKN